MIVWDTETDGLPKPEAVPVNEQPQVIEFAGIKLNDKTLSEEGRLQFYCNPGHPLPDEIVKATHITDEMLKDQPPFVAHLSKLQSFFLGQPTMAAHFLEFDRRMLVFELTRLDMVTKFPWPPKHICTMEVSNYIKGHRLSLADLYIMAAGKADTERVAFKVGQVVFHKSVGKCEILAIKGDKLHVKQMNGKKAVRELDADMFIKRAAFEGAHGAMKDAEELVACVRWLRKEGKL